MAIALAQLQRPLDIQNYLNAPEDGERFEIINGEMIVLPPPSTKDGWLVQELGFILGSFVRSQRLGLIYTAPVGVRLSENDIVEPDLFYVSEARRESLRERYFDGPPELVVEVMSLSSLRTDRIRKMALYQRAGVREYWIADPATESIHIFALQNGRLVEQENSDGMVRSLLLPGLEIEVEELFSRIW